MHLTSIRYRAYKRLTSKSTLLIEFLAFLIVLLIIFWAFDIGQCATKYLYFSSEVGLFLLGTILYLVTFTGVHWNDPPMLSDERPKPHWRRFSGELGMWFLGLVAVLFAVWIAVGTLGGISASAWLKRAVWSGYMLGVFVLSILVAVRNLEYINAKAAITSSVIMVYFLSTYEITLLSRGIGWSYNNTVVGYVFGIPLDNVLFVYTVTPFLIMVFYSIAACHFNETKAFWLLTCAMAPVAGIFEILAVYPLNVWRVYTAQSVWPMGRTSIEEFLFYFLMQFLSVALYAFFCRNFTRRAKAKSF